MKFDHLGACVWCMQFKGEPCGGNTRCANVLDGEATCAAYCDELGVDACATGQVCLSSAPGSTIGLCLDGCSFSGVGSSGCDDLGMETCFPVDVGAEPDTANDGVCVASGTIALGEACSFDFAAAHDVFSFGECVPGAACIAEPFLEDAPCTTDADCEGLSLAAQCDVARQQCIDPVCRAMCPAFTDDTGCEVGEVCAPRNGLVGYCSDNVASPPEEQICEVAGRWCDQNLLCVDKEGIPFSTCVELCRDPDLLGRFEGTSCSQPNAVCRRPSMFDGPSSPETPPSLPACQF